MRIQEQLLNIHNVFIQMQKLVALKNVIAIRIGYLDTVAKYNRQLGKMKEKQQNPFFSIVSISSMLTRF